ncbi:caspase family protein [Mesorhizobium sp. WSM3882]|uniref:caspase family protein n=1 Tax=Mesorhizobium sp. WSM3882 TaxID=2029407 RepID=UPI0015C7DA15|nr:caspase family protein [Mesorhizobium sp. WSM3882]
MSKYIGRQEIMRLVSIIAIVFGMLLFTSHATAARKALVIGIGAYDNVPALDGPTDDAKAIYNDLVRLGYNSTLLTDEQATGPEFNISWSSFLDDVNPDDDVVVYYSGHGVEIQGTNYIVPKDVPSPARLGSERALAGALVPVAKLMDDLNLRQPRATIWILDACRDNPFKVPEAGGVKALGGSAGLVISPSPAGTFVFYAAGFRETALARVNNDTSKNSLYTRFFIETLDSMPESPVNEIAVAVREKVREKALPHIQRPAYYDGLVRYWCFRDCAPRNIVVALNTSAQRIEVKGVATEKGLERGGPSAIAALSVDQQASLQDEKTTNAVFLGRRSFSSTCIEGPGGDDKYPFGCDFLKKIVAGDVRPLLGRPVAPLTETNIRRGSPIPDSAGLLKYQCVVGTLRAREPVTLSSITEAQEGDETYYWGAVQGRSRDCDGSVIPEAVAGPEPVNQDMADPELRTLTGKLVVDDTKMRRQARNELGHYIAKASNKTVEQLTTDIADKSYRYQLGVSVALAQSQKLLTPAAQKDLATLLAKTEDPTLRNIVKKISGPEQQQ